MPLMKRTVREDSGAWSLEKNAPGAGQPDRVVVGVDQDAEVADDLGRRRRLAEDAEHVAAAVDHGDDHGVSADRLARRAVIALVTSAAVRQGSVATAHWARAGEGASTSRAPRHAASVPSRSTNRDILMRIPGDRTVPVILAHRRVGSP